MPLYFAYGSNMSQGRLEQRVGRVRTSGIAELPHHVHAFSKRGQDGSGKGNLEDLEASSVYGVIYDLSETQFETLLPYEKGYSQQVFDVKLQRGGTASILTFKSKDCVQDLRPTSEYVAHYLDGLTQHDFPDGYRKLVLRQIKIVMAGRDS